MFPVTSQRTKEEKLCVCKPVDFFKYIPKNQERNLRPIVVCTGCPDKFWVEYSNKVRFAWLMQKSQSKIILDIDINQVQKSQFKIILDIASNQMQKSQSKIILDIDINQMQLFWVLEYCSVLYSKLVWSPCTLSYCIVVYYCKIRQNTVGKLHVATSSCNCRTTTIV